MVPIGQPYRPSGTFDLRSILITSILGTTAAFIGAGLVWLWEWSPIPTLVLITPMLQGLGIGWVMAFAIGRLRMRNPMLVTVVGFICGLLSIVLVHYGHYMHLVSTTAAQAKAEITEDKSIPDAERKTLLTQLESDPAKFVDPLLAQHTHHSGFLGSLFLRNEQGVMIRSSQISGFVLWILWAGEALFAATFAALTARSSAAAPYCDDCGHWCEQHPDVLTLPSSSAAPLAEAVRENDIARIAALRASPAEDDGTGSAGVTLHACPGCDQSFADVSHRVVKRNNTKTKTLLKQHRVSPELVAAIRTAPAPAADAPPSEAAEDDFVEADDAK